MNMIIIEFIPHEQQRYCTAGDWTFDHQGNLKISVSDLGDLDAQIDVAIHELIEARLCQKHDITDHAVTMFDIQFEREREAGIHSITDEPGDNIDAPYHNEHQSATFVERAAASVLGVDWEKYDEKLNELRQ